MKRMTIDELVRWAVSEEWPKARPERRSGPQRARSTLGSYIELLAVIDANRFGVVPDLMAAGDPHPDAEAVAAGLALLRDAPVDEIDPDWLIGDMVYRIAMDGGDVVGRRARGWLLPRAVAAIEDVAVRDRDGQWCSRGRLDEMVTRAAILGGPSWSAMAVTFGPLRRPNGTAIWRRRMRRAIDWDEAGQPLRWAEIEVDAPLVNGRRPAGAYPAEAVLPDPREEIVSRARYVVWRAALRALADVVAPRLTDHEVDGGDDCALPWLDGRPGVGVVREVVGTAR